MIADQVVDQIQRVREANNKLWMDMLRLALKASPDDAKKIMRQITENDRKVTDLMNLLS